MAKFTLILLAFVACSNGYSQPSKISSNGKIPSISSFLKTAPVQDVLIEIKNAVKEAQSVVPGFKLTKVEVELVVGQSNSTGGSAKFWKVLDLSGKYEKERTTTQTFSFSLPEPPSALTKGNVIRSDFTNLLIEGLTAYNSAIANPVFSDLSQSEFTFEQEFNVSIKPGIKLDLEVFSFEHGRSWKSGHNVKLTFKSRSQ